MTGLLKKTRDQIDPQDTWDLQVLFANKDDWDKTVAQLLKEAEQVAQLEGKVQENSQLLEIFDAVHSLYRKTERACIYAQLKFSEDLTQPQHQEFLAKADILSTKVSVATAFFTQELSRLSDAFLKSCLDNPQFSDYQMILKKILLEKPHILSLPEEQLLSKQGIYSDGFQESFSALGDGDLTFGSIQTPDGEMDITHETLSLLLENKDRKIRQEAFDKYYTVYHQHLQVLTRLYSNQVKQDCTLAEIRHYPSALESRLKGKQIPVSLYRNLIERTRSALDELHDYYALLKKKSGLSDFSMYDTSVPFFDNPDHDLPYEEAVALVCEALSPLKLSGSDQQDEDYVTVLREGLTHKRWVDKYESQGKTSGGFSCSSYDGYPYILLNYNPKSFNQVFTLAHEAGHSMHSYYSNQNNPYSQASYTIFEAEVASTVNEFFLYRHLIKNNSEEKHQAFFLWKELKDFIATFFRQVMFAEFEWICHQQVEKGEVLSSQFFIDLGKRLLEDYYGPAVHIPETAYILGLRIPHFYRAFYVFQYATGISAATAIASKIYQGDQATLKGYYQFLKSGGSRFPIDSLRLAGVDFTSSDPIDRALAEFKRRKDQLKELI